MGNKTADDYEYEDIIIAIPQNTVEFKITTMVYENNEITKLEGTFNLNDIHECKKNFEDCLIGNYPTYILTDKGREFLDSINK